MRPSDHPAHLFTNAHQGGLGIPAMRTYRHISEILATRGEANISPARVAVICLIAEAKIASAMLTETSPPERPDQ